MADPITKRFLNSDTGMSFIEDPEGNLLPDEITGLESAAIGTATGLTTLPLSVARGSLSAMEAIFSLLPGVSDPDLGADALGRSINAIRGAKGQLAASEFKPIQNFAGQMLGGSLGPGGPVASSLLGGLAGAGEGETGREQLRNFGIGMVAGPAAAKLGRGVQRGGSRLLQSNLMGKANAIRSAAAGRLQKIGFPLSAGDAAPLGPVGHPARQRDVISTTLSGDKVVNAQGKNLAINRELTKPLGQQGDNFNDDFMAIIDDDIDDLYGAVRRNVPDGIQPAHFDDFSDEMADVVGTGTPKKRLITTADELDQAVRSGDFNGQQYTDWRQRIGEEARGMKDPQTKRKYYEVLKSLDTAMEQFPGVGPSLRQANKKWRYREVWDKGAAITPQDNVNLATARKNMENMYGKRNLRRGTVDPEVEQAWQTVRDAQHFPGFQDSGTARREGSFITRAAKQAEKSFASSGERLGASGQRALTDSAGDLVDTTGEATRDVLEQLGLIEVDEGEQEGARQSPQ